MKCSKTFTLHVEETATCPVYDATGAGLDPFVVGIWSLYSDSTDILCPTKTFGNGLTDIRIYNAATHLLYASVAVIPAAYPDRMPVEAAAINSILFPAEDTGTGQFRIYSLDVNTHALNNSLAFGVGENVLYLEYDAVHNEVTAGYTDAATVPYIARYNATTLAFIAQFTVGLVGNEVRQQSYDASRDRFYVARNNAGVFTLEGYNRTTGVLSMSVGGFAALLNSSVYCPDLDIIVAIDNNNNVYRVNPATAAIEATVPAGVVLPGAYAKYWPERNSVLSMFTGGATGVMQIGVPSLAYICTLSNNAAGCNVGINNTDLMARNWANYDYLFFT